MTLDVLQKEIDKRLRTIEAQEDRIHALLPDETAQQRRQRIMEELQAVTERWRHEGDRPPLFGVLVGVKDLFHARGFPVRAGSRLPEEVFQMPDAPGFPHRGAREDSESVARLREAGALILGKTVSTEFAYFGPGPTANPLNHDHTPGGSSSGSAAAVAAGYCDVALGTQTIGSISRPATFCGVVGYKPSWGRISVDGVVPFSARADHVGVIAKDVKHLQITAQTVVAGWQTATPPAVPAGTPKKMRLLIPDDAYLAQADVSAGKALQHVADRLQSYGVTITRVNLFPDISLINTRHEEMVAVDFSRVHAQWFAAYSERYHQRSAQLISIGQSIPEERYGVAIKGQTELRARIQDTLSRHEATFFLAPATVSEAPKGLAATGSPIMNLPWTYAGVPTVSLPLQTLPAGRGPAGLPLGIQLAAPFNGDESLLAGAAWIEQALQG
jgi:Asp-tRNA(Asn)/Glu-tRNA(Gln) amidotransferase A subunit family amidase